MSATRILVVEDEEDLRELLRYRLEQEGFQVEGVGRGDEALEKLRERLPDLMLLDLMLPGLDGLELAKIVKRDPRLCKLPLIMLTAKGEEVDRIVGLELGAEDYITKPFSPREVALRIKAVLRRIESQGSDEGALEIDGLRLDIAGHRLFVREKEVVLTATEFRLLKVLAERRGRVQTRGQLLSDVWGYSQEVDSRTIDTHIRRLRQKLGVEADRIETVIGVGYRLRG
ncbi:MAG TPA: response regulator [Thermoanaerobaculia bacterium]|nr:response regulator [Thermoanaerobaculia bacterium]